MDCEKVRDRFSSLWERELTPLEEKIVREHLSSCPECQRELRQFEKTMQWLHSVGEEEVPDGFLIGLYKKMEDRKSKKAVLSEGAKGRWFVFPTSMKLPAQAAAMVAIVFLVLYLTKMMPMEVFHMKDARQTSSPLPVEKKSEQVLAQKEAEREPQVLDTPASAPRPKDVEQGKAPVSPVPREGKMEGTTIPEVKTEAKKAETPSPKTDVRGYQRFAKESGRANVPSSEAEKMEKGLGAEEKPAVASKPPREIILRISDREKVISRLHELIKQFGGETVTTEGNMLVASLPMASFSEFEKELAGLSSPARTDKVVAKKHATGSLSAVQEGKREEVDGKSKEPGKLSTDKESRMIVHILLVQE